MSVTTIADNPRERYTILNIEGRNIWCFNRPVSQVEAYDRDLVYLPDCKFNGSEFSMGFEKFDELVAAANEVDFGTNVLMTVERLERRINANPKCINMKEL